MTRSILSGCGSGPAVTAHRELNLFRSHDRRSVRIVVRIHFVKSGGAATGLIESPNDDTSWKGSFIPLAGKDAQRKTGLPLGADLFILGLKELGHEEFAVGLKKFTDIFAS